VIEPLALAGAAIVLLIVTRLLSWDAAGMAGAVLVSACLLLAAGSIAFRGYRRALDAALSRRWLRGGGFDLSDASTRARLEDDATRGGAEQAAAVVSLLADDGQDVTPLLTRLVAHDDAEIRAYALEQFLDNDAALPLGAVVSLAARETAPEVRAVAARLAARAAKPSREAMGDPDPKVRRATVAGLLESPDEEARRAGQGFLDRLANSSDAADRADAARIAAMVGGARFAGLVVALLGDGDLEVRAAALSAVVAVKPVSALPLVVDALGREGSGAAAASALVAYGPAALDRLGAVIWESESPSVRVRAARVVGRIDDPDASGLLVAALRHPDRVLRGRAASLLAARGFQLPPSDLDELSAAEVARAADALAAMEVLDGGRSTAVGDVLATSLLDVVRDARDQVLRLLMVAEGDPAPRHIRRAITGEDDRQRAYALESLDTALPQALKARILPLMRLDLPLDVLRGRLARGARPRRYVDAAEALRSLALGSDRWLASLALTCSDGDPSTTTGGSGLTPIIERVLFLKRVEAFSTLPADTLAAVASLLIEVQLDAGETLFEKGDDGTAMYIVIDGSIRIHDGGTVLGRVGRHGFFGELALLERRAEERVGHRRGVDVALPIRPGPVLRARERSS
jgi:HEAT repeat protein